MSSSNLIISIHQKCVDLNVQTFVTLSLEVRKELLPKLLLIAHFHGGTIHIGAHVKAKCRLMGQEQGETISKCVPFIPRAKNHKRFSSYYYNLQMKNDTSQIYLLSMGYHKIKNYSESTTSHAWCISD